MPMCTWLQEKMRTTQKQLDELTRQVSTLLSEKSQLETRTRILEQVVYLNTNHEQMLHANQVCAKAINASCGCIKHSTARPNTISHAIALCSMRQSWDRIQAVAMSVIMNG